ncbi:hypothetical protein V6N11_051573 [Hibiscus sabdariffa]|uniref:Uncharacterized protein n=1 Tax=Hibiscus sabdariffa TaxID=183260 RepID=A0ABR2U872_9ROSI
MGRRGIGARTAAAAAVVEPCRELRPPLKVYGNPSHGRVPWCGAVGAGLRGGTDYDFASRDPHKAREEIDKLQTEQSSDFGSIFSTLLPGTMAKLEPPEGCSFLDGLEVRVALVVFGSSPCLN